MLNTQESIRSAAKAEFLQRGFRDASLREIARAAQVTTGALYGYYRNKEELFSDLVGNAADALMTEFQDALDVFSSLPPEQQSDNMGKITGACMDRMVDYIYSHYEEVKLLICCAEGTEYADFIHRLCKLETDATHQFMNVLKELGQEVKTIEPQLEHILISGMFSAFFEMVRHDMPRQAATQYTKELRLFYMAGWQKIMGF